LAGQARRVLRRSPRQGHPRTAMAVVVHDGTIAFALDANPGRTKWTQPDANLAALGDFCGGKARHELRASPPNRASDRISFRAKVGRPTIRLGHTSENQAITPARHNEKEAPTGCRIRERTAMRRRHLRKPDAIVLD